MKHLLLALALLSGDTQWQGKTEQFAGITCPTAQDAERIANVQQAYNLASTVEMTHCLFVAFNGRRIGESEDFSIGGTLYSFLVIDYEGYTVYVLQEKGQGWTA